MKNFLIISAIGLIASNTALADGFYVGAGAGASALFSKDKISGTFTAPNNNLSVTGDATIDSGNIGFNGTILSGYQWKLPKQFALSIEAFDNMSSAKSAGNGGGTGIAEISAPSTEVPSGIQEDISVNTQEDIKIDNVFGARFLPGYLITPELEVYTILGYARAHATVTTSNSVSSNGLGISGGPISTDDSLNFNGYQLGFGMMTQLTKNLSLRSDIIYTGYISQTISGSSSSNGGASTGDIHLEMSTLEGNIDLVYSFG